MYGKLNVKYSEILHVRLIERTHSLRENVVQKWGQKV